ncbi:MAG: hypothetical protein IKN37_03515, partial [Bacteroidales bacterium]|nr:hypothetical protein [Bacteroidales bacterium]
VQAGSSVSRVGEGESASAPKGGKNVSSCEFKIINNMKTLFSGLTATYSKFFLKKNKKRCNSINNLFTFANRNK